MARKINKEDIQQLSDKDLKDRIQEETLELKKRNFAHAVSPLENPLELRWRRKDIARLKTELRKREIQSQSESK